MQRGLPVRPAAGAPELSSEPAISACRIACVPCAVGDAQSRRRCARRWPAPPAARLPSAKPEHGLRRPSAALLRELSASIRRHRSSACRSTCRVQGRPAASTVPARRRSFRPEAGRSCRCSRGTTGCPMLCAQVINGARSRPRWTCSRSSLASDFRGVVTRSASIRAKAGDGAGEEKADLTRRAPRSSAAAHAGWRPAERGDPPSIERPDESRRDSRYTWDEPTRQHARPAGGSSS